MLSTADAPFAFLESGTERRVPRSTRSACRELGMAHLENVRQYLMQRGVSRTKERINVLRPRMPDKPQQDKGMVQVILKTGAK